jgi:tRNA A-37 threonylcarbamoyl transferase component Bud32
MQPGGGVGDLSGQRLGPYQLESRIGGGFFGQVYLARHRALGVPRAVKVMHSVVGARPEFAARFLQEAQTAASLSHPRPHPNIVAIHDFGVEGSVQYLVMEYVNSITLAQYLERVPVARRRGDATLRQCIWDIAKALDFAHGRKVVHRDLKPANILMQTESGRALLTDFGIAWVQQDVHLTQCEQSVGTYAYMSPEQCESAEELTAASDIYGLAATLYEVAAGAPPFGRGLAAVAGHLGKEAPGIAAAASGGWAELDAVLARGLAKAPGDRYPSAGALATAFLTPFFTSARMGSRSMSTDARTSTAGLTGQAPVPPWRRLWWGLRDRRLVAGGLALGVMAAVATLVVAHRPQPAPTPLVTESVRGTIGAPVQLNGYRVSVLAFSSGSAAGEVAGKGQRVISVTVAYSNQGATPVVVSPYDWVVIDAQGNAYSAVEQSKEASLPQTELPPNRTARGVIQFDVPDTVRGLVLRFGAESGYQSVVVNLRIPAKASTESG